MAVASSVALEDWAAVGPEEFQPEESFSQGPPERRAVRGFSLRSLLLLMRDSPFRAQRTQVLNQLYFLHERPPYGG